MELFELVFFCGLYAAGLLLLNGISSKETFPHEKDPTKAPMRDMRSFICAVAAAKDAITER